MPDLEKLSQKVIEYSFYALFFLVPLIMTPLNFELFEFNKMLTVYFITTIIVSAWLVKMVATKKFIFHRSFWDIPLGLFFISQLTSFLFSIDRHTSWWGYYSRFNGGLLSIICYSLLYWAFTSNMLTRNTLNAIRYTLISATLVAGYGIAEHFGIDAKYWVQDVRNRVFSTLGQPNWLAAWLVALTPLTWSFALLVNYESRIMNQGKNKFFKTIIPFRRNPTLWAYSLFIILYSCLLFTRSRSGLLGFGVAFFVFWPLTFWLQRRDWKTILRPFFLFTFSFLLLTFLIGHDWVPGINRLFRSPEITEKTESPMLISESGDIRKVVWKGAADIWRHYPIFGTGPETFAYSYYWYRPREHNDLSEWDFLYNKAHNEYLNYGATTGTVGLGSYLILILSYFFWSLSKLKIKNEKLKTTIKNFKILDCDFSFLYFHFSFLSGFSSIVVTNFFGFSVVPVNLLFYLFPAFAVAAAGKPAMTAGLERKPPQATRHTRQATDHIQHAVIILILLVTYYLLRVTFRYWLADAHFARGEKLSKAGQYDLAFNTLQQAVRLRPIEPVYHDELGLAAANLAVLAENQKNATLSARLTEIAIASSNKAVGTSPYHLNFWKNRTKIFYKLAEIKPEYYQQALVSLLHATGLAPTEPKIKYNLGLIYAALDQTNEAIKTLEETVELKPNYEDPRYALALFYEQRGEKQKAREQLEYILDKINPVNEKAKEKLEQL